MTIDRNDSAALVISEYRWAFILRGLLAVPFGLLVLFWSKLTLTSFSLIFALFAVSEAMLLMISGRNPGSGNREWSIMLEGIGGAVLGICALCVRGGKESKSRKKIKTASEEKSEYRTDSS